MVAGRSSGRLGQPGRAWPAAHRHRRKLLAVPPLSSHDAVTRHRLAPVGQVAASVRARARMGSGADRVVLARRRRQHGFRLAEATSPSAPAPICCCWRWPRCWCAAASASAYRHGGRGRGLAPGADPHRPRLFDRQRRRRMPPPAPVAARQPAGLVQRLSWTTARSKPCDAAVARRASRAIWCASSIRRKRIFPITGRTRFESPQGRTDEIFGRAERVRDAYRARFAAHGEAHRRRRGAAGLDRHRPSHRSCAAGALIALHAAIGGG